MYDRPYDELIYRIIFCILKFFPQLISDLEGLLTMLTLLKGGGTGLGDALSDHPELLLAAAAKGKTELVKGLLQGQNVQVGKQ